MTSNRFANQSPMLGQMKRRMYFDTSAINWLFDHPYRDRLVADIRDKAEVHISIFTVAEMASTSSKERRTELMRFARKITYNWRPLAWPGDLLKRSLDALVLQKENIEASMGAEWNGLWTALCNPEAVEVEECQEAIRWKNQQEEWYQTMHDEGRDHIQKALSSLPEKERRLLYLRPSNVLRHFAGNKAYIAHLISEMAERCGHKSISEGLLSEVLKLEDWRFFLAAMAYGLFVRSVQKEGFSKKRNPGSIDTQQAIYLAGCDVFATADWNQRTMVKWLLPLGYMRRKVSFFAT